MRFLIGKKGDRPPEMSEETFDELRNKICELKYISDYDPDSVGCSMLIDRLFSEIIKKPEIACLQGRELIERVEKEIGFGYEKTKEENEKKVKTFISRLHKLQASVKTFTVSLDYSDEQGKRYYHLLLSVPQLPDHDRSNPFYQQVQVTEKQAKAIIAYLITEGFLDHAQEGPFEQTPVTPCYLLSVNMVSMRQPVHYREFLGWDLNMLQRLDRLRKVLEGNAASAMDILIGRMAGLRAEWERQAASATPMPATKGLLHPGGTTAGKQAGSAGGD